MHNNPHWNVIIKWGCRLKSGWIRAGGIFLWLLVSFSFHHKGTFLMITGKIKAVYIRGPFSQLLTVPLSRLISYISLHTQILSPVLHLFTPDRLISTNSCTRREHHTLKTWPWSPEYSCSLLSPSVSQSPSVSLPLFFYHNCYHYGMERLLHVNMMFTFFEHG